MTPNTLGAKNWKKAEEHFYKMDEESIVTIREELSDDFYALAETQIEAVQKLIKGLEDDQLDTQLQFERYEWERPWVEAEKRVASINISDEEQFAKPQPQPQPQSEEQLNL